MIGFFTCGKTAFTITFFTALLGFSGAATVPPVSGIISQNFGTKSIATLFGVVFFVHQIGGFLGAWLGGVCFETVNSYTLVWVGSIVFSIFASAISFAIKESKSVSPAL